MSDKIVSSTLGEVTEAVCSFCNQERSVVRSGVEGDKAICFKCVYKIQCQIGKIPAGAIQCFKCKSLAGFLVTTNRDKKVEYLMTGRDFKGCIKYVVKGVEVPRTQISALNCTACGTTIPLWMLEFTTHV